MQDKTKGFQPPPGVRESDWVRDWASYNFFHFNQLSPWNPKLMKRRAENGSDKNGTGGSRVSSEAEGGGPRTDQRGDLGGIPEYTQGTF